MNKNQRILVVEDNPADAELIRELLPAAGPASFQVESVARLAAGITRLACRDIDLVLLDLGLPDSQGLQTLQTLRQAVPGVPVIVLTGNGDDELSVNALKHGAQDYLVKGQFQGNLLVRSIRYAIERHKTAEALRLNEERYRSITRSAADAIVTADATGRICDWNPGAERIFGYSLQEIRGQAMDMIMPPRYRGQHHLGVKRMAAGGDKHLMGKTVELHGLHRDGREFPLELSLSEWQTPAGEFYTATIRDITERKLTEASLQASEERFRTLVAATSQMVWQSNSAGENIADVPSWQEFTGQSSDEIRGYGWANAIHPDDRVRVKEQWARAVAAGTKFESEYRIRSRHGHYGDFAAKGVPVKSTDGSVREWVGIITDVTDRKRAEEEKQQRTAILEAQINSTIDGILIVDEKGNKIIQNQRCVDLWKIPRHIVDNGDDKQQVEFLKNRTKDPEKFAEKIACLYAHPDEISRDEVEFKDGMVLDRYSAPVIGENGTCFGRIWVFRDITKRKRMETALQEEQVLFHNLADTIPDKIYFKDRQSRFVRINQALARQFGLRSAAEAVGKTDFDMFGGEHAQQAFDDEQRIMATGEPMIGVEEKETWSDGRITWVSTTKIPVRDTEGRITGLVGISRDITARKQAETALQQSELRFHTLAAISPVGIFQTDAQGQSTYVNPRYGELSGLSAAEALGDGWLRAVHPEDRQKLVQGWQTAMQAHSTSQMDYRFLHPDGSIVWVMGQAVPETDPAGRIVGYVGNITDITERKRAEEALREQEHLLAESQRLGHIGSWFYDMSGPIKWSEEMYHIYGVSPETFTPTVESLLDLIHPEDRPAMQRWLAACAAGEKPAELEFRINHPDGTIRHIRGAGDAVMDAGNKIIYMAGTVQDITEHKLVGESHARLAMAVEQAAESIVITDINVRIIYANPAFEKSSGYTRAEALGQNPRILKSGRQDASFYRQMWEVLARGENWHGHFSNKRKDGTLYEEEATISPIRDAAGKIINYVAVKRDVTNEMQLQSQYQQAQKMEAFGQLAGGVAHDFNNILAVIQLQAGLLKAEQSLSPEQLDFAREIEMSAKRGADLTLQLLLFSRKQTMQPKNFELKGLVENIAKMLRRTLGENFELQMKFAKESLVIHADAGMMDQVLLNLTVNARDAMPKGGQIIIETSAADFDEVTAAQHPQARPGSFVCLSVTDTGSGIPPEILPRIFEPFFTTKEVGKGTGLGLATVFGIVQQHQGWIHVYSEVNRGTTFRVFLPRQAKPTDTEFFWSSPAAIRGGSETILLVEDENPVRSATRTALTRLGYRVLEASKGDEAVAIWKQHRDEICLLLTDLVMPGGMNGKELAAQLLQENPKLKVIYTSGYSADVAGKDLVLEDGVNFLSKPFQSQTLLQTIRKRLDQK